MSDDQVASFNIDNREAPGRLGTVALANDAQKAVRVGDNLVALGSDWYTQQPQLVVVPIAGGASALPIATIELALGHFQGCEPMRGNVLGLLRAE